MGITPACAGKSRLFAIRHTVGRDHPRVCGEKLLDCPHRIVKLGSPPRVRGKVSQARYIIRALGITPACAGKRQKPSFTRHRIEDHPRVCGEKIFLAIVDAFKQGSPPRVRGKGVRREIEFAKMGITPACAGKRLLCGHNRSAGQDHPRVCGEKKHRICLTAFLAGSPPRVRGKDLSRMSCHSSTGITPACAGKSVFGRCFRCRGRDHPRVCGEKTISAPAA